MAKKQAVRSCVAGLIVVCALASMPTLTAQADTVTTTIQVGSGPIDLAINPAGTFAYVTNSLSGTVSKIDLATDTVSSTINVGLLPNSVAINPAGTFAYVTNYNSRTVSKIDLATDTVSSTISASSGPIDVVINPAGTFAYVTDYNGGVSKINLATDTVSVTAIRIPGLNEMAINTAGTFAYGASGTGRVSKINLATETVSNTIDVGAELLTVVINTAGTFAYVTNYEIVSEINLATFTVSNTISVGSNGSSPYGVAINPAGTFAYVTNSNGTISKIRLATETFADITVGSWPQRLVFNPAGTFAYVTNYYSNTVSKIVLTATDPQSITFSTISMQLSGTKTMALSATASSPLPVAFTSATPTVCSVSGSTATIAAIGDCSINANQSGGSGWDAAPQVTQTFTILPSPPVGEAGVSIKNGDPYTNTKQVTLNLIWPEYATSARISNDGGFAASKTQTKDLAASIDWDLDDSIKGIYPKVVYVRFNGVANTTQTYSDDIILDTTGPVVESASAMAVPGAIDVSLKATDDITGVDKVQIKNGATTVTKDYATKVSVPLAELSLSALSMGIQKLASTSVEIRVSDKAGNWSAYTPLSVSSAAAAPTVTKSKSATAKSIALFAKIPLLPTSKVSLKVVSGYAKFCKVSGTTLKGLKAGTCKVTVTVTPKKGKAIPKTITLKVTN